MSTSSSLARGAAGAALALAFAGCVSIDREAEEAIADLRLGGGAKALAWSGEMATNSHYSARLGEVEAGRVNLLLGDTAAAQGWFRTAIDHAIDRSEAQPKVRVGDVGNTILAATVTDDRTRQYELSPYELNLALEYAILAQDAAGRRDEALVDCRLAAYVMDSLAETYGADAAQAAATTNAAARGVYAAQAAQLEEVIASTRNSWENPLLWWLTGVCFEADGDREAAAQSYLRAAALRPENPVFQADAAAVRTRRAPAPDRAKLVVVCGEGFVSRRQSLKVPVPLYTGMAIDIPMYRDAAYVPRRILVSVDGAAPTPAHPALNVQALAYRDLKEHLPGIIARNITRAAVQATAQAVANHAGNNYVKLGVFAVNAVISALREADTRSWRTLPMGEQVWRDDALAPGPHTVDVDFAGARPVALNAAAVAAPARPVASLRVDLAPGETRIVYINSMED